MHFTTPALLALATTAHAATSQEYPHSQYPKSQYPPPETSHASQTYPAVQSHTEDGSSGIAQPTASGAVIEGSCPLYKFTTSDGTIYGVYCDSAITGTKLVNIGPRQAAIGSAELCATRCNRNNACVAFNFAGGSDCVYFSEITGTVAAQGTSAFVKYMNTAPKPSSSSASRTTSVRPPFPTGSGTAFGTGTSGRPFGTGTATSGSPFSTGTGTPGKFVDWKTYKANGVNIGAWLEQEQNYDTVWWANNVGDYPDEWTWCGAVGFDKCGPPLEKRFGDWVTKSQIDTMGKLKINTLRIPTTYAAWVEVPGSNLYRKDHASEAWSQD